MTEQENRERVIDGLEATKTFIAATKNMFEIGFPNIKSDIYENALASISDAIELLSEQEAMEPVRSKGGVYHCGGCGEICVGYEAEYSHSIIKIENYCHKCGRAVKWE